MDDKALTAVATSLALMQIQVNALMLLLERHIPDVPIKGEFQELISEGVQTVGIETMGELRSGFMKVLSNRNKENLETAIIECYPYQSAKWAI
jgi:hypothetical protein